MIGGAQLLRKICWDMQVVHSPGIWDDPEMMLKPALIMQMRRQLLRMGHQEWRLP